MSTTIRLKNSSALVSGKAKEPTPSDLAQGELAVNINKDDPSLFVKDSDGVVRKIAGSDAVGVEGQYLSIAADAEAQTVATTETTTFKGLVDADKGISVTGGTLLSDANDSRYPLLNGFPGGRLEILPRGTETSDQVRLVLNTPDANGAGGGAQIIHNKSLGGAQENVLRISGIWTGDYTVSGGNTYTTNAYLSVTGNIGNTTTSFSKPIIGVSSGANLDTDNHWVSFSASGVVAADANKAASYIGYLSKVQNNSGEAAFGFYGSNAPNFFEGNTYIGGTATRNTRELWESTLTEEQQEQLAAGTLAIPANVSTPGDGSFVRQWWYNQQSAEDQALIDSGELEYPERYQPENFVDTFALGVDTNIDLLSNGQATFKSGVEVSGLVEADGGIKVTGGNAEGVGDAGIFGASKSLTIGIDSQQKAVFDVDSFELYGPEDFRHLIAHQQYTSISCKNTTLNNSTLGVNAEVDKADITSHAVINVNAPTYTKVANDATLYGCVVGNPRNDANATGVTFRGFSVLNAGSKFDLNIGYYSGLGVANEGKRNFNFFTDGSAPNFFGGNTYIGGTATRSTRELWESTLTEEQQEQLSAGTLAIPANVSTPGDGSFVRQWWYDQQSAEDQALIDSGELDYPKNFQAANFTDTFDLGENTKINLLSDGVGEFSGGVRVTGSGTIDNGMTANNGVLRFTQNSQQAIIIRDTRINASGRVFNFAANSDAIEIDGKQVINGIQCTLTKPPTKDADDNDLYLASGNSACQFQAGFDDVKFAGSFGFVKAAVTTASNTSVDHFWGYNADNSLGLFNAEDPDSTQKVTGYYTDLQQRTNKNIYAFYSARNAPSYFNGAVTGGGTDAASAVWSIDSTGTATGIDVTAASVVTDADNGTVETLLDIITDLRSRIKDLEEG